MAIPDFQTLMLPLLKYLSSVESATSKECINHLAKEFQLTDDEIKELLSGGLQTVFTNRVNWAGIYLIKAGLIIKVDRGVWRISNVGIHELKNIVTDKIDSKYLMKFEGFKSFRTPNIKKKNDYTPPDKTYDYIKTPKELLEDSYSQIRNDLAQELLQKVKECSPEFFENLVVDLLIKMGYGGSRSDAGKAIGRTNDGGIDGVINEDRLGLDNIYIQAKRWDDASVGQPEIQKFVGAMAGRQGTKGVFITTSAFTQSAKSFASAVFGVKIKLIDGNELAQYMIDFDVGTSIDETYVLKRIDSDYFTTE